MAKWGEIKPIKGFTWTWTYGASPSSTVITVPKDIEIPTTPQDITLNDNKTKIVQISAISERQVNATMKEVVLVDQRYFWQRHLVYAVKNQTISQGAIVNVTQYDQRFFNQPIIAPKTARESRTTIGSSGEVITRSQAYSAWQLLNEFVLQKVLGYGESDIIQEGSFDISIGNGRTAKNDVLDNDYIPLNWTKLGIAANICIDELLDMLNCRLQITNDGKIRIWSPYNIEQTDQEMLAKKSIGEIAKIQPQLQRPRYVRIKVPKRQEVIVHAIEMEDTSSDAIVMYNVTQLPYDLKDASGNLYYRHGYYPIEQIIKVLGSGSFTVGQISFSAGDSSPSMTGGDTLTPTKTFTWSQFKKCVFNEYAWNNLFLDNFNIKSSSLKDVSLRILMSKLQQDFRRLYQINPRQRNQFFMYAPIVGVPLDASTGASAPSPVYCDYSAWLRYPTRGLSTEEGAANAKGAPRGINVAYSESKNAPFFVNVENEALGILSIQAGSDFDFIYESYQLTKWNKFPTWGDWMNGTPFESGSIADPNFNLSVVLSVVLYNEMYVSDADDPITLTDKDKVGYIDNESTLYRSLQNGTSDETLELSYTEMPAIFSLQYGWINKYTIKNIVDNVIMPQVEAMFRDNLIGVHEVPQIDSTTGYIPGRCNSLRYVEMPDITKTVYIFNEPLPPRPNWKGLSSEAKRMMFRNNIFEYKI